MPKSKMSKYVTERTNLAKKQTKRSNVNIKQVDNGFVVCGYKGDYINEKTYIAKTEKEAKAIAAKML